MRYQRAGLLAAILFVFLLGQVVGGQSLWFHSHGEAHGHVHFLPAHAVEVHAWHADQHTGEDDEHDEGYGTPPAGYVVHVPPLLVTAHPVAPRAEPIGAWWITVPAPTWQVQAAGSCYRPDLFHSGWPPERTQRSGVVALLRSSHALLI